MDLRIAAGSILVVEDDWLIADQIETLVVAAGYKVIGPTGHPAEAIELAAREQIAAALLDIELSRGDQSYPVAEALMARGVPFAFVSSLCRRKIDLDFPIRGKYRKTFPSAGPRFGTFQVDWRPACKQGL